MDDFATLNTYAELMSAIKQRHHLLMRLIENQARMPDWCVIEFTQLQVRKICETLAMACLVAHGDIEGTRSAKITKSYQADFIMNALEKLHPNFYPRPVKQIVKNGLAVAMEDIKTGFLTKADILKSYHTAADFLHVGDLKDVLSRRKRTISMESIIQWSNQLLVLLAIHQIYLVDAPGTPPGPIGHDGIPVPKRQIGAVMHHQNGHPQTHIFERVDPQ